MFVLNLFHLKNTNGIYYYALDYLREKGAAPEFILARPALCRVLKNKFPESTVLSISWLGYIWWVMKIFVRSWRVYTPSSHPMPFISRQMVVLHDTYPFLGRVGRIKAALFLLAAKTSRCFLAYINHADGLGFYQKHKFDGRRLVFAPNCFPGKGAAYGEKRRQGESRLIVGLVGSDSPKKNYAHLCAALRESNALQQVLFLIYGHETNYLSTVTAEFPDACIELVKSDEVTMPDFLASIDVLVSVARNEGFGRPVASALQSGVPCFLLDNPVFREFFEGGANFYPDVHSLVVALLEARATGILKPVEFQPSRQVVEAFSQAVLKLRLLTNY